MKVLIYDRTCKGPWWRFGLSHAWLSGSVLYRAMGRFDTCFGAANWEEALRFVAHLKVAKPIDEIQYWGHGKWGKLFIAHEELNVESLAIQSPLEPLLAQIRHKMHPDSLWWFRTCETFGMAKGHQFARQWASYFGCKVAGHTYRIGVRQSGLHLLAPGQPPAWPEEEGLANPGEHPPRALFSQIRAPNTISCFHNHIPASW